MPTYEYRCEQGHEFEQFQAMSEPPVSACPQCGAKAERLLSAGAGLLFKGSGFYITDYRSESYKKAAEADRKGSGKSGSSSDAGKGSSAAAD
ncbi:MAG TPA: FmdB family zinc ribbon protein [Longimicrobiales bacterium]|nr:FmdB family zinc ribbon protein [Longimicrobiales bacterium]